MKSMPILYISGPFSSNDNLHGVEQNILTASKYALKAWKKGWAAICPHKNTSGYQHIDLPYEIWINGDLAFIDRLDVKKGDALLMLPDWEQSKGAQLEHEFAKQKGLTIYYAKYGIPNGW